MKNDFSDRLKEFRKTLGLTQEELATRMGLKRNTIATYEMGKYEMPESSILLLCRLYNISRDWLQYGEGEMFLPDDEIKSIARKYDLSPKAEQVLENFLKMDQKQRDIFVEGLREITKDI